MKETTVKMSRWLRYLCLPVLVLLAIIILAPVPARAGTEGKIGGCKWELEWTELDKTATLTISPDGDGVMPDFEHYKAEKWTDSSGVTHDSDVPWINVLRKIDKIVIRSGVKNIGNGAFYIPNRSSGKERSVYLPEGIRLGDYAFRGNKIKHIQLTKAGEFGEYVFENASLPAAVQISASEIGPRAFAKVFSLEKVTLNDTVKILGEGAFDKKGTSAEYALDLWLPKGIDIGSYAFRNQTIERINLYQAGTIGEYAFTGAILPEYLQISAVSVGDNAFQSAVAKTIVFNATVKEIGESAFMNCRAEYYLGSGIRSVGAYAFAGYSHDYRVDPMQIPSTIETIGEKAFGYTVKTKVDPETKNNVLTVGDVNSSFVIYTGAGSAAERYGQENGIKVVTGNKLFFSDYETVDWDYDLDTKTLRLNNYTYALSGTLPYEEFMNMEFPTPAASDPLWASFADDWGDLVYHVVIGEEYDGYKGFTRISDGFHLFPNLMDVTVIDTAGTLTYIDEGAFADLKKLRKVTLNENMETIGARAFSGCTALAEVDCGKTVYEIGEEAFSGCSALTKITFSKGLETVGDRAFEKCGLRTLEIGSEETLSIWENYQEIIRGAVITFGEEVFSDCLNLTDVIFGEKVISTGKEMFLNCPKLEDVSYTDQLTALGEGTFRRCVSLEHFVFGTELASIGENAFLGTAVNGLFIPYTVTEIGDNAFGYVEDEGSIHLWEDAKLYVLKDTAGYEYAMRSGVPCEVCDGGSVENVVWRFNETTGELTISGIGDMPRFNGNYTTAPWSFCSDKTKSITIGDGITLVSREAFGEEYYHLESVTFGKSVETIQAKAFYNCPELTDITIPETAVTIGNKAFGYLQDIYTLKDYVNEAVTLHVKKDSPAEEYAIERGFAYDYIKTEGVTGSCTYSIDLDLGIMYVSGAGRMGSYENSYEQPWIGFRDEIKYVIIEDGVTNVGKKAFMCFNNLTKVILPETITEIEEGAFANDPKLEQLYVPDGVTSIAERSIGFSYIYIDSHTGEIAYDYGGDYNTSFTLMYRHGSSAFWNYRNSHAMRHDEPGMEGVVGSCFWYWNGDYYCQLWIRPIGEGLNSFKSEFYPWEMFSDQVKELNVEPGIDAIPNYAFSRLENLETANLNYVYGTITSIGQGAFEGCQSLKAVYMPWQVTELCDSTFYGCISLEWFSLNEIRTIGDEVFSGCKSLKTLYLGADPQLESIGENAFAGTALSSFSVPKHLYHIGPRAFYTTPMTSVDIPRSVTEIEEYAFGYRNASGQDAKVDGFVITAPEGSAGYRYAQTYELECNDPNSGWLGVVHWKFSEGTGRLTISGEGPIPDFEYAQDTPWYRHEDSIRGIVVEEGITAIGKNAFSGIGSYDGNRITKLQMPRSLVTIGEQAFAGSFLDRELDLVIPLGTETIGEEAFSLDVDGKGIRSISLPPTLISIGEWAFVNTSEESVEIPDSVTSIGDRAFGFENLPGMGSWIKETASGNYVVYGAPGSAAEQYVTDSGWDNLVFEAIIPEVPEPQEHVHEMIEMVGKEPTTEEEGWITYYVCEDCGEWFEDPDGEIPIEDHDSVILPKIPYISKTEATIAAGKTLTLTVENAEVTKWATSNKAIATVSSAGKVTAVAPGKCTIAATLADGSKLRCTVTVVKISKTAATLQTGKTLTLKVEGMDVTKWTSSDKAIATVGSTTGKVKGVAAGTATITATLADGTKLTCKVTVVKISKTAVSLAPGKALTLKVTGMKVKSWASSAKTVATVTSAGKVTALKKGTAKITATLMDGTKLVCTVTVTKNPTITVNGKTFKSTTTYSVKKGSYLTVKVTGKASTVKNVYASSKATVAKVISANTATTIKIKGLKAGTATVTIKINGVAFKIKVKVTA